MFFRFGPRQIPQETIERLYGAIMAQSRLPSFYLDYAVSDTPEGRFELLVLHVHLVFRRLAADEAGRKAGQRLFDYFIADMDAALRELGIGDMKVGKKMRGVGEAYYGRAHAYDSGLNNNGETALAAALQRNVYAGEESRTVEARHLAHYVIDVASALSAQETSAIADGSIKFPDPLKVMP